MEKKSRKSIVIGITSLFLVMLILVGLTYAYYRTRIIGNNSTDPSISVVSKKLEIKYKDGNSTMNMEGLIEPGFEYTKTFTVENTGDDTVGYVLYLEDVVNEYTRTQDWTYEITCSPNCNGTDGYVEYPTLSEKLLDNEIASKTTQTYNVTIKYANSEDDQSDDMGATLEGKFNIYSPEYVVDIEGEIEGASEGDYVQINSVKKVSKIVNGKYRLPAVGVGSHTLRVMSKTGTEKGSTTLTINKGTQGINGTTITMDDKSETVTLNITNIASNLGIEIKKISEKEYTWDNAPAGTLIYALRNNNQVTDTKDAVNYTEGEYSLQQQSFSISFSSIEEDLKWRLGDDYTLEDRYKKDNVYVIYATDYTFDETYGIYKAIGISTCKFVDCYSQLKDKYILNSYSNAAPGFMYDNLNVDSLQQGGMITSFDHLNKVTSATMTDDILTINYVKKDVISTQNQITTPIATTLDDDGTSYYYRGNVENNYVNFSGMCWRIVRVQGDGAIKLVLADDSHECNNGYSTTDTTASYIKYNNTELLLSPWDEQFGTGFGPYDFSQSYPHSFIENWINGTSHDYRNLFMNEEELQELPETITFEKKIDTNKLIKTNWCNDSFYYIDDTDWAPGYNYELITYGHIETTLKCHGRSDNNYFGVLTKDEVKFARENAWDSNSSSYLKTNGENCSFLYTGASIDDYQGNSIYSLCSGKLNTFYIDRAGITLYSASHIRPAVTLRSDVTVTLTGTGTPGTYTNPYEIK